MTPNNRPSERAAVVAAIDPDAYAAGTYTSGWVAAKNFAKFLAIVMVGDLGASGTVDAKIQQATSSGGAGAKDLTGSSITQLTQAGTDSDKQALINFSADDLDLVNGFTHVRVSMTVATAASDAGAVLLGFDARFAPASDNDATTVDEIVSV